MKRKLPKHFDMNDIERVTLGKPRKAVPASSLRHLGKQSQKAVTKLDLIPWVGANKSGMADTVTLRATEFTSHCPVTRQPDFGVIEVIYGPDKHLVETKSFKLYLWRFRDVAKFNEAIVAEIADDFMSQVQPHHVRVTGTFNLRGGIGVTMACFRCRPDKR